MKKPSLDGTSIKNFLLYHCEKLILGLSIVLLGLFFWLGYSTPTYEKVTPSKLLGQTQQAHRYVVDKDAWTKISDVRQGDDEVIDRILQIPKVEPGSFVVGPASYPVKRDAQRRDAILESPFEFGAKPFYSIVLIQPKRRPVDTLAKFPFVQPVATAQPEEAADGRGGGDSGGRGAGAVAKAWMALRLQTTERRGRNQMLTLEHSFPRPCFTNQKEFATRFLRHPSCHTTWLAWL